MKSKEERAVIYYVMKNGRTISDFPTLEEAQNFAKVVDGDIAVEEKSPDF